MRLELTLHDVNGSQLANLHLEIDRRALPRVSETMLVDLADTAEARVARVTHRVQGEPIVELWRRVDPEHLEAELEVLRLARWT